MGEGRASNADTLHARQGMLFSARICLFNRFIALGAVTLAAAIFGC